MLIEHTPAPWLFNDNDGIAVTDKDLNTIANLHLEGNDYRNQYDLPNARANALLIAAAPDLLEALELAVTMLNDLYNPLNRQHSPTFKTLQAAIARAKGV